METLKKLGTLVPSKESQAAMVQQMVESVVVGGANPLDAEALISWLEGICKDYRKNEVVKGLVKDTLEEAGGKATSQFGTLQIVKTKVYDYEISKTYLNLVKDEERIKEQKKKIEEALKAASDLAPFVDQADGTIIDKPPVDYERVSVRVTLNKEA